MITSLRISAVFLAALLVAGACQSGGATTPHSVFSPTGPMSYHRSGHTATLLPSGKVLIVGGRDGSGPLASAELYEPSSDTFAPTGSMASRRAGHTATLLTDGKVLIAGGEVEQDPNVDNLASAELYDPATGSFSPTASMSSPRSGHTATLLPDGKVLIAGGAPAYASGYLASAELYDPGTGSFSATGYMPSARTAQTATLLANGKVLITGGYNQTEPLQSSALYDPGTGRFSSTGSMSGPRWGHAATSLPSGKVLVTGGYDETDFYQSAELYDPSTGSFSSAGTMTSARFGHAAILLASGKVLITGGYSGAPMTAVPRATAELYDPDTGSFSQAGSMTTTRTGHTATLLASGAVLIAGGAGGMSLEPASELYTP